MPKRLMAAPNRRPLAPKRPPLAVLAVAVAMVCALALPLGIGRAALGVALGSPALPLAPVTPTPALADVDGPAVRHRVVGAESRTAERPAAEAKLQAAVKARKAAKPDPIPRAPGMQRSCKMTHRFPATASSAKVVTAVRQNWGVRLTGPSWKKKANADVLRVMWRTLDSLDCTPFLKTVKTKNDGGLIISGEKKGSWAWGDYGYSDPDGISFSLDKMADAIDDAQSPRVVRVMVHEMAHAWSADRNEDSGYFKAFAKLGDGLPITDYGAQNTSENFAEAAGYFVARCAVEQSDTGKPKPNPYDDAANAGYYKFVGKLLFGNVSFGPAPGRSC